MRRPARSIPLLAVLLVSASPLFAQPAPLPHNDAEPLVSSYDPGLLRDLPTNDNLFTVIDILQPSIVSDRIVAGGLFVGQPARVGGFLSSWTQTIFRLDGVPFTDPSGNGAPFLVPDLLPWAGVRIGTGAFSADTNAAGLAVDLSPAPPPNRWRGIFEGATSHGRLLSTGIAQPTPPVAYVDGFDRGGIVMSGPLAPGKASATFALSAARGAQLSPRDQFAADSYVQSALTSLRFTPNSGDTVQLLGLVQRREQPLDQRFVLRRELSTLSTRGGHGQLSWDHRPGAATAVRLSTSFSERRDAPDYGTSSSGIADRLVDGPMGQFTSLSRRHIRVWSAGVLVEPRRTAVHHVFAGADLEGGRLESSTFFTGAIGELVHGVPARIWQFAAPSAPSRRRITTIAGYAGDRVSVGTRLSLEAGVRVESIKGSAEGGEQGVRWQSLLPRASAHLALADAWRLAAFGSYSRSGARLSLDDLAVGDPGAPFADVYRWTGLAGFPLSLADRGARVARVGPGTGGNRLFAAIDPDLKRPLSDEVVLGIQAQPRSGVLLQLAGVTRKERNLSGLTNVGAPASTSYTSFPVQDPGSDVNNPDDDQTLTVYNRIPASFGNDRYLLTTPDYSGSTFRGVELTLQVQTNRLTLTGGATAGMAQTFAASTGYGPLENDQTVLGELFTNPNASTLAHGRPFTDRPYSGKFAFVYRFPRDVRLGLVARYQDGQPFSRVLVLPGLNQGADAVRAFPSGNSRFKFVGTLDGRLQKRFPFGERSFGLFIDAYNVLNMHNAVEEDVAGPPDVRTPMANQPPRSIHLGVRVTY